VETDLVSDEREGRRAEGGGHLGPDGYQRRTHDGEGRWICDTAPVHELDRDPEPLHLSADLGPGPVDDDGLAASMAEVERLRRGLRCNPSTQLENNPRHARFSPAPAAPRA